MSAHSASASPGNAQARGHSAPPTWTEVPATMARMLWRHWPPLVAWFFAMRLSYDGMRAASMWLAERSILLAYIAVAMMIVVQLGCSIAMFLAVRPSMRSSAGAKFAEVSSLQPREQREGWMRLLAAALLPFFAYYTAWGLLEGLRRDFLINYLQGLSFDNRERLFDILSIRGIWVAVVVAHFPTATHGGAARADRVGALSSIEDAPITRHDTRTHHTGAQPRLHRGRHQ